MGPDPTIDTAPDTAAPGPPADGDPSDDGHRFTLPSAYTILFALIVVTAIATWIIPAGQYALDPDGSPLPGTYQEVDGDPQRIVLDSIEAPYLPLVVLESAGLPLDPSFAEQKKIFERCKGLFYSCANGAEARRFNRLLIDAGLIKGL